MTNRLPRFTPGQRTLSARKMNNLAEVAEAVSTVRSGSFYTGPGGTVVFQKRGKRSQPTTPGTTQIFLGRVLALGDLVTCRLMDSDSQDGSGDPIQAIARKAFSGGFWDWQRSEPFINLGSVIPLYRVFGDGVYYTLDYYHLTCETNAQATLGAPSREPPFEALKAMEGTATYPLGGAK